MFNGYTNGPFFLVKTNLQMVDGYWKGQWQYKLVCSKNKILKIFVKTVSYTVYKKKIVKYVVGHIFVSRWEMPFTFLWQFEYSRMLSCGPIFCICFQNPRKCSGKCVPHFPIGQKMKFIKIENKICHTKDPTKRWKNDKNTHV